MNGKKVGISIGVVLLIAIVVFIAVFFLKPKQEETFYKVTFNNNGVTEVVEVKESNTVTKPTDPQKEGWTFEGWYYNGTKFNFTTEITQNITLEARWTVTGATKHTVKFDTAGGEPIDSLNVVDGEKIDKVPTPTKEGYTFAGWYYNETKYDFKNPVTKNITLTAKWEKNKEVTKHTVKFDTAGGSKVESKTVEDGKTVTKPTDPKKEGHVFVGWYNGTKEFDFKTKVTQNLTLTAKWKKIESEEPAKPTKYTVKFDTAGGNTIADKTVEKGSTVAKPENPKRDGYTFIAWYHNDTQFNFSTTITNNITLTAKWEKNKDIKYVIEDVADSYVGQVRIFVLEDGVKVDGIVDITTTNNKVVTNKEIPKDGYLTNGAIIKSITNVRVK